MIVAGWVIGGFLVSLLVSLLICRFIAAGSGKLEKQSKCEKDNDPFLTLVIIVVGFLCILLGHATGLWDWIDKL